MRLTACLALIALALSSIACGEDDSSAPVGSASGNAKAVQEFGEGVLEVTIGRDGFDPGSAKVAIGQPIRFRNADSVSHTIELPSGREQVVESGAGFTFKEEGCCAATFSDEETGTEFEVVVPRKAALSD